MRNISSEFRDALKNGNRRYSVYADITLKDGTKLGVTNENLWQGGFSMEDSVSSSDSFDVGAAIINKFALTLNNIDDKYSKYDFSGAEGIVYAAVSLNDFYVTQSSLRDSDGQVILDHSGDPIETFFSKETEKIRMCTGRISDPPTEYSSILTLTFYDNMTKFDRAYSESKLEYPATIGTIVRDACSVCGVTLQTVTFPHHDFVVQTRPNDEAITFREVISWCAQIVGCFCRCDVYGRLELRWFKYELLETQPEDSTELHKISTNYQAPTVSLDDVVITGVKVVEKNESEESGENLTSYQAGTDGYVITIENNELIKNGSGQTVAGWLGQQLIGFRFRKASMSHASDPSIEAGDVGILTDRKGREYRVVISSTRFSTSASQSSESSAKSPAINSAARYSSETKNYVDWRNSIKKEKTEREKALEELANKLANSPGVFTSVQTDSAGGKIFYLHNKPKLEESDMIWKMTAEAWGVSTDGGKTWNAGMTVDGDTIVRILTAVGVNADWINAGAITVKDSSGSVLFSVNMDAKKVVISGDTVRIGGKTIQEVAKEEADAAAQNAIDISSRELASFSDAVNKSIEGLQAQVDGQIESYFYEYEPTLQNIPASQWTSNEERKKHEGDLFYNKLTGYGYRFFYDESTSTWKWQLIQDTDITKALAAAEAAQDTADAKRRNFLVTPYPPYDIGDSWTQDDGEIMTCTTSRSSGQFVSTDWKKLNKYTDDTELKSFITGEFSDTIESLKDSVDKKAETWYQATDPAVNWTGIRESPLLDNNGENVADSDGQQIVTIWEYEKYTHEGDLWHNTTNNKEYIYQSGQWVEKPIPDDVFDEIDGKSQIFVKEPIPPYDVGDTWFTGKEILVCNVKRASGSFVASDWGKREKYTDDTALTEFLNGTYKETIKELQTQVDGKAETWRQSTDPAVNWTTSEEKASHKGDLWYNTGIGKAYIYTGSEWTIMTTQPPTEVFDEIDGKASVFVNQPKPPYRVGDLWFNSGTADIMTCNTTRLTGNYNASDWEKRNKYTDDTAANNAQSTADEADKKADQALEAAALARNMSMTLDNDYQTIAVDENGNYSTFPSGITTSPTVMYGQQDITADCSYAVSKSASIQGSWDDTKRVFTVTGITADNAWVDIKAVYIGALAITKRFTVSKLYAGETGAQGIQGIAGRTYFIELSANVLKRGQNNAVTPSTVSVSAYYRDGTTAARVAYAGRWQIQTSTNGTSFTTVYTSSVNENSKSWSVGNLASNIVSVRFILYAAGGTSTKLDMQSIPIVIDVAALTHEQIFNLLTNNGAVKGLYKEGNQLFVNATYIKSGTLSADLIKGGTFKLGGAKNGNGVQEIYDANGKLAGRFDNNGIVFYYNYTSSSSSISYKGIMISKEGVDYVEGTLYSDGSSVLISQDPVISFSSTEGKIDGRFYDLIATKATLNNVLKMIVSGDASFSKKPTFNAGINVTGGNSSFPGWLLNGRFLESVDGGLKLRDKDGIQRIDARNIQVMYGLDLHLAGQSGGGDFGDGGNPFNIYGLGTATGSSLVINGNSVYRSSSSRRYKTIGRNVSEEDLEKWYQIQPVWAKYKNDYVIPQSGCRNVVMPMLIAEDVETCLPTAAVKNEEGLTDDWSERVLIPAMFAMIKSQKQQIDELRQEINEIKQLLKSKEN